MSSTTLDLPFVRYVKRVTNGALLSKYSYLAMMADNANALKDAPWKLSLVAQNEVSMPVNKVSATDATYDESGVMTSPPSFNAFMSDAFDAFQQGGDARKENATMCGYAGCVAYRFKIPTSAASIPLSSVSLLIQRDRYCRAGVRVALALSNEAYPSNDWDVVRGTASGAIVSPSTASEASGVASWGFLGQSSVGNLISSRADDGTITFNASGTGGFPALSVTGKSYLWVYLTLEDYQSYWTMYNATDPRYYSIEGSAMLVASRSQFTFSGDVTPDSESFHAANVWALNLDRESRHEGTTPATMAAYGNLLVATHTSLLAMSQHGDGVLNTLLSLDKIPAHNMHSYSLADGISTLAGSYIPKADLDIIGGMRNFGDRNGDNYYRNLELINWTVKCCIVNKATMSELGTWPEIYKADGTILAPTIAYWKYLAVCAPVGKTSYSRMRMFRGMSPTSPLIERTSGFDCDLLIWKSTSPSLYQTWADAAVSALAGNAAFFTGSKSTISGTITGDGEITNGTNVQCEASLLQRVDLDGFTGTTLDVELTSPVNPGEVLIITPSIKRVPASAGWSGTTTISFDMDYPDIQLA